MRIITSIEPAPLAAASFTKRPYTWFAHLQLKRYFQYNNKTKTHTRAVVPKTQLSRTYGVRDYPYVILLSFGL